MQSRTLSILNEKSTASLVVMALLLGFFTVAMETAFQGAFRLPGHRAYPGALALLVFAEAFAPMVLVAFAGAVSSVLVLSGYLGPWFIGVWVLTAVAIWLLSRTRFSDTVFRFLLCGLLFGLLSFAAKSAGAHHTPQLVRAAGHLGFGAAGGLTAFGALKGIRFLHRK